MGQTVAEKIFETHVVDRPAEDVWVIRLDAVLCHEITTPTAILDLMSLGKDRVFDPSRIKAVIDHVTPAKDSNTATQGKVLREWARRHHITDFFDIGRNGVCHALFPEKGFIRPGYAVIMGDSHTCTDGAFGAFTPGVGTTDLAVGILKGVCAFRRPQTMKITLTGELPQGVFAKDVILSVIGRIGVGGATNRIVEFDGPVVQRMNMEARMTLCNMTVEAGGTCGICYGDAMTADYLWEHIRGEYPDKAAAAAEFRKWWPDPDAFYEESIVHDVSGLAPMTTFGQRPDNVRPVREMEGTPIDQVFIGSC
ncbi:MAG: aconitase family protein, partial [Desulfobacterales bacterium]|nr:aconitase family protein [Desulfobacterales bacterium]